MKEEDNELCRGCWKWRTFKEKCNFYWQRKKECFRWQEHPDAEEKHKSVDNLIEIINSHP